MVPSSLLFCTRTSTDVHDDNNGEIYETNTNVPVHGLQGPCAELTQIRQVVKDVWKLTTDLIVVDREFPCGFQKVSMRSTQ
jgi:hypothetical protein